MKLCLFLGTERLEHRFGSPYEEVTVCLPATGRQTKFRSTQPLQSEQHTFERLDAYGQSSLCSAAESTGTLIFADTHDASAAPVGSTATAIPW